MTTGAALSRLPALAAICVGVAVACFGAIVRGTPGTVLTVLVTMAVAIVLARTSVLAAGPLRIMWGALALHAGLRASTGIAEVVAGRTGGDVAETAVQVLCLAASLPLVVALVVIAAASSDARLQDVFVDAAAVAIVAGLAIFQFVVGPLERADAALVSAAHALAAVLILGGLAAMVFAHVRATATAALLAAAATVTAGQELLLTWSSVGSPPTIVPGAIAFVAALAPTLLFLAAVRPGVDRIERRLGRGVGWTPRLVLLGIATIVAPVVAVVLAFNRQRAWIPVLLGAAVAVSVLVMLRLTALVRHLELERLRLSATEARLAFQATHDVLTGLPNRALLTERLGAEVARAHAEHRDMAVLFIDLDDFKVVNDTIGHVAGDELLRCIAGRLRGEMGDGDTVGRVGGDEFVVVSPRLVDRRGAVRFAQSILAAVTRPVQVAGEVVEPSVTIGVALRGVADDPQVLLANADLALYAAKSAGRACVRIFDHTLRHAANERTHIEAGLRRAVGTGEIGVEYQPLVDLTTGRIASLEALARWSMRPDVAVGRFIEVAESTGIVERLGEEVLDRACADVMAINQSAAQPVRLSVNVSMRQLLRHDLADVVAAVVARHRLPRDLLSLEITETFMAREPELAARTLAEIRSVGVRIEIDDFGVGHTSFRTLSALPIDGIKIDKSLVDGLRTHEATEPIVSAIVAMARALGLATTVEGIENIEDLAILRRIGCDLGQGFLFSRPVPFETVDRLVATWPSLSPAARELVGATRSGA